MNIYCALQVDEYPLEYSKEQSGQQKMAEEDFEEQIEKQDGSRVTKLEEVRMTRCAYISHAGAWRHQGETDDFSFCFRLSMKMIQKLKVNQIRTKM